MYKCLVCDKPVSIPAPTSNNNNNNSNNNNNNQEHTLFTLPISSLSNSSSLISRFIDDNLPIEDQQQPQRSTNLSHSPIKKQNLLSSPSLRHYSNSITNGSPSNDLPLPPVIASPGVSYLLSLYFFSILYYHYFSSKELFHLIVAQVINLIVVSDHLLVVEWVV